MTNTPAAPMRPLGAQISHMLKDRGVEVIFGIPGVHNQEMYRGIEQAGLQHVLARHEQGAGFMADGYARATGRPGVCYVITGPGLCNIMTPMGQAYSDSVPMLVISSCLDDTVWQQGQLHQMRDQEAAAATVTDWSHTARDAQAAYQLVERALCEFETGRPRPKHMQVTISALGAPAPSPPAVPFATPRQRPVSADEVDELARLLDRAQAPVIIVGGGHKDRQMVCKVADNTGAALFTTFAGRGKVPEHHPRSFGAMLARPSSVAILAQADLIVAVGTTLDEGDLWRTDLGHTGTLARIDIDPLSLIDRHAAAYRYQADSAQFMTQLAAATHGMAPAQHWRPDAVAAQRAKWRSEIDAERPGIVPVADALYAALPDDCMIYSDMTQFAYAAQQFWPMDLPGHWHHPTGFGTLGYALPAAIGGAVGRKGLPTLCIAGDYGFQYTVQELATAVELKLPLPIFLWDNGKLGEIEDSMVQAQIAPNAVIQQNPDFGKLADAYGAHAVAPCDLAQMQDAVRGAFSADRPTLIHVRPGIA